MTRLDIIIYDSMPNTTVRRPTLEWLMETLDGTTLVWEGFRGGGHEALFLSVHGGELDNALLGIQTQPAFYLLPRMTGVSLHRASDEERGRFFEFMHTGVQDQAYASHCIHIYGEIVIIECQEGVCALHFDTIRGYTNADLGGDMAWKLREQLFMHPDRRVWEGGPTLEELLR